MQNTKKYRIAFLPGLLLFLLILVSSCTSVYFENPVPQAGTELRSFPEDWAGVYLVEPTNVEEASELEQIIRQSYRLERPEASQLLVSTDYRIHEKDMPRFRKALEEQKVEGTIIDYQLSERFIICQVRQGADEQERVEQLYTAFLKEGEWYVLSRSVVPFRSYDLGTGGQTDYESKKEFHLEDEWLPGADSLSSKTLQLTARQKGQAWFFNSRPDSTAKWSLLYLQHPDKDRLIVKISNLNDSQKFEERIEYYNGIVPFQKQEDKSYLINPDDKALDRLMREDGLFQTTYLRRIRE